MNKIPALVQFEADLKSDRYNFEYTNQYYRHYYISLKYRLLVKITYAMLYFGINCVNVIIIHCDYTQTVYIQAAIYIVYIC